MRKQKPVTGNVFTIHLLEQATKLFELEKLQTQTSTGIMDLIASINRINLDMGRKIEGLEKRIQELEQLAAKEAQADPGLTRAKLNGDDFN